MTQENLEIVEDRNNVFRDKKYEIFYYHDIKEDFETEYKAICEKYCRRIENFRNKIKQPTVFFRFVLNHEEVDYINANWEYAESLLKRFNQMNKIVYIYRNGLEGLTKEVKSFCSNTDKYVGDIDELRHLFDESEEFLSFCAGLLPVDLMGKTWILIMFKMHKE